LGMQALIIDLRDNPGGVLNSAIDLANRFIAEGTIVSTRSRDDSRAFIAAPEQATLLGLPLVLLVDGGSASASEVLTGAIQDYRVGAIVGMPTYGKGLVQTLQPYGERAVVKITTALYTTPANRQIDRNFSSECAVGLDPDLAVPITKSEQRDIHASLARFSPPHELMEDIRQWEADENVALLPEWPQDAQLHAAIALFAGKLERTSP
jgi:carboxyl-terminal processing protease